jgi:hypothetical protein
MRLMRVWVRNLSFLQRIISLDLGRSTAPLAPKMLNNAQKEQICRLQERGRTAVGLLFEFLQTWPGQITT